MLTLAVTAVVLFASAWYCRQWLFGTTVKDFLFSAFTNSEPDGSDDQEAKQQLQQHEENGESAADEQDHLDVVVMDAADKSRVHQHQHQHQDHDYQHQMHRQNQRAVIHELQKSIVDPTEDARRLDYCMHIVKEMKSTETTYVSCLSAALLKCASPHPLNGDLMTLVSIHRPLLESVQKISLDDQRNALEQIVAIFERNVDSLRLTIAYIQRYHAYQLQASSNNSSKGDDAASGELESLLITPVQRIPRYLLLFSELQKKFPHGKSFAPVLQRLNVVLKKIKDIASYCNEKQRDYENATSVMQLFKSLKLIRHFQPSRRLVKRAELDCTKMSYRTSAASTPHMSGEMACGISASDWPSVLRASRPSLHTASVGKRKTRDILLFSDMVVIAKIKKRATSHVYMLMDNADDYFDAYSLAELSTPTATPIHATTASSSPPLPSPPPSASSSSTSDQSSALSLNSPLPSPVSSTASDGNPKISAAAAYGFVIGDKQTGFVLWAQSEEELHAWIAAVHQVVGNVRDLSSRISRPKGLPGR
eukprot:ANDGO_01746.mRNA.1 Guanine exchange factor for Rac 30